MTSPPTAPTVSCLDRSAAQGDGLRLFCFHHAGGDAAAFARWDAALGPGVRVLPVQLPGRGNRKDEPRMRDMAALVTDLDAELGPVLEEPYAFYGHSMGALVAYALVRRRHARGARLPRALLVGASPGPYVDVTLADDVDDARLVRFMLDLGGAPEVILRFGRWMADAAALLRDDLAICRSARPGPAVALPVPITVFTGTDDPVMTPADATGWAEHTSEGATVHVVPGGHFFPRRSRAVFLPLLAGELAAHRHPVPARERNHR